MIHKVLYSLILLVLYGSNIYAQLGGYTLVDHLVTAVHPNGCTQINDVTGPPEDSTWVNFANGDVMTGTFGSTWRDNCGDELLLETSFHRDNYRVRLITTSGFSAPHNVITTDWTQIANIHWKYMFTACGNGNMANRERFILPLDFGTDFGLTATDIVTGIEITFLTTSGAPDFAGAYIIQPGPPVVNPMNANICQGDSILLGGVFRKTPGTFNDTLFAAAANGCDSINSVTLAINPAYTNTVITTSCGNYTFNGQVYTSTGIYTQTLTNPGGCDSIISLDLTVNSADTLDIIASTCNTYTLNGQTYSSTGIYSQTIIGVGGCDSIINLDLTVTPPDTTDIVQSACGNYTHNGQVYNTTGLHYQTLSNVLGCDSVLKIDLTILSPDTTRDTLYACPGEAVTIHGNSISTPGNYAQTFIAANGCDSVDQVSFINHPLPVASFTANPTTASSLNPTINFTNTSTGANSYVWNFGDSTNSILTDPDHLFDKEGVFNVQLVAFNQFNCSDTTYLDVIIAPYTSIYLPNAFTPNGDNINDFFGPRSSEVYEFEMWIYDRWGNKIYHTSSLSDPWDGKVEGSDALVQQDVYVWLVTFRDSQGVPHQYTGHVSLIR